MAIPGMKTPVTPPEKKHPSPRNKTTHHPKKGKRFLGATLELPPFVGASTASASCRKDTQLRLTVDSLAPRDKFPGKLEGNPGKG